MSKLDTGICKDCNNEIQGEYGKICSEYPIVNEYSDDGIIKCSGFDPVKTEVYNSVDALVKEVIRLEDLIVSAYTDWKTGKNTPSHTLLPEVVKISKKRV